MSTHTSLSTEAKNVLPCMAEAASRLRRTYRRLRTSLGVTALLSVCAPVMAATAPASPSSTDPFAVVSSTYTNTVAGTTLNGNLCFTSTGPAVTPVVNGTTGCPAALGGDQATATAVLTSQACTTIAGPLEGVVIGANPPGVFPPGCYTSVGALNITANGIVNLVGNGVYVFRSTGGAITTGANSIINLAGGACAANVFWTAVGTTTLGGASALVGSIYDAAGITLGLAATVTGRALGFGGTVTTNGANTITVPSACAASTNPALTVTKVSNGGVGAFGFTGTNGFAPQTITTATPGVGVSGATQTLTAAGVVTTITESAPPAGFALSAISCSGLGAGGTATPNIVTRTVSLDAAATAAGATILCTFTNALGSAIAVGPVPTLSEWAMIVLAGLLVIAGFAAMRRRAR
jgi:hypothetical protein